MKQLANLIYIFFIFLISGCISTKNLDPIYDTYPKLGIDTVESEHYELVKVANLDYYDQPSGVSLMTESKNFIVDTIYISHTMLNSKGDWLSSYIGRGLESSGVSFTKDHYVDWPLTGDKKLKNYSKRINLDTLSKAEFEQYYNKADRALYKTLVQSYPIKDIARCLLKIDGDWVVIETELPESTSLEYNSEILGQEKVMYGYKQKNEKSLYEIENIVIPWYKWEDSSNLIYIKEKKRIKKSRLKIATHQELSGWDTESYFNLKFGDEILKFKALVFESSESDYTGFWPSIALHIHPTSPNIGILIVKVTMGDIVAGLSRPLEEAGIYVLRKKKVSN